MEKTKEEKRILGLYKAAYETSMREKEGFCGLKKRRAQKKKKEGINIPLFVEIYRKEEEKRGEEEKIKWERVLSQRVFSKKGEKTKVYIHKENTLKPFKKEIKHKEEVKDINTSDLIEKIRARHKKSYREIIEEGPAVIRPFDYSKNYLGTFGVKAIDLSKEIDKLKEGEEIKGFVKYIHTNKKIDYNKGLLPYNDITEESVERVNRGFLREEYYQSFWRLGRKQISLSFSKEREREEIIGGEKHTVIRGRYITPIRSKVEKKRLYGRSNEVNIYRKREIKNREDYQKNQKMQVYWRDNENPYFLLRDLKTEINSFSQKNNFDSKKAFPFLVNLVNSINMKHFREKNPDTMKQIREGMKQIKDRLMSEQSKIQI